MMAQLWAQATQTVELRLGLLEQEGILKGVDLRGREGEQG